MGIDLSAIREAAEGVKKQADRKYQIQCEREQVFPAKMWQALADLGLLGLGVPEELGGMGGGVTEMVALVESLSQAGLKPNVMLINHMSREVVVKYGTEAQRQKFVAPNLSGKLKFCFQITEPDAGTNSFKIRTAAKRTANGSYRVNGQKIFTTNFHAADYSLLVTRTTPYGEVSDRREGMTLFMLDTKSPGITKTQINTGLECAERHWSVYFDDVEIPAENRIGEEGKGFKYLFNALNPERLFIAAMSVGAGDFVLAKAVEYAKVRAPFDRPIGAYQGLQHPMARAKAHLEAARCMMYNAAEIYDAGGKAGPAANMAKLLACDAAVAAVDIAIQVHAGMAFDRDTDILPFHPYTRAMQKGPITTQMILNYIGEHVLGLPKSY